MRQQGNDDQVRCLVRGIMVQATPEELVRQAVLAALVDERQGYCYPLARLAVELPIRLRRNENPRYADIAIYADDNDQGAPERRRVLAIIEVKDPETEEDGYGQAEGYASHKLAQYAAFIDGVSRHRLRGVVTRLFIQHEAPDGQPAPYYNAIRITDIPACGSEVQYAITELRPFLDVQEAQRTLHRCHDFIREAGRNPLQAFADMSRLLFAKVVDELITQGGETYRFQVGVGESAEEVTARIQVLLRDALDRYDLNRNTFRPDETVNLPAANISRIVDLLQPFSLSATDLDIKGTAFQVFLGANLRGEGLGQFFTPRNVVQFIIEATNPTHNDRIIDPACGTAGFLLQALNHVREEIDQSFRGRAPNAIFEQKMRFAQHNVVGLEWEPDVARSAKVNMLVSDDGRGNICEGIDSLLPLADLPEAATRSPFTIALTNPPFGTEVRGPRLQQFLTAHKTVWQDGVQRQVLRESQDSTVLFIERCLHLLEEGGRLAIVLPNGVLNNSGPDATGVRQILNELMVVDAVVRLPPDAFQHVGTGSKTSVLFARKKTQGLTQGRIFMARVSNIGYNVRGGEIAGNQLPDLGMVLRRFFEGGDVTPQGDLLAEDTPLTYCLSAADQGADALCRWDPCYFEPHHRERLTHIGAQYPVVCLGDHLVEVNWRERHGRRTIVELRRRVVWGRASRRYIREQAQAVPVLMVGNVIKMNRQYVLDLLSVNWVRANDHEFIDDSMVRPGDVLVVRTGATIGKVAVVPEGVPEGLNICSDILRLRLADVDPYYVAAFLTSDLGQRQLYANISGSTNEHLDPEALEFLQVPLLPGAERIGEEYRQCIAERLERDMTVRGLIDGIDELLA